QNHDSRARQFRLRQNMRRDENRMRIGKAHDKLTHGADLVRVEANRRFVEDDQLRFVDKASANPTRWRKPFESWPTMRRLTSVNPHCSMTVSTRCRQRFRVNPFNRARNFKYSFTRMSKCSGLFSGM